MRTRYKLAWSLAACALALFAALWAPGGRHARDAQPPAEPVAARTAATPPHTSAVLSASEPDTQSALVSTAAPDRHPHPITAEHRRLYRDADLIDGAAALLRKNAVPGARALLAQHRTEYAPGEGSDNEGLALLADCIEHTDAASINRARAFYDRNTHSMVRRQIRKQCLEAAH